VTTLHTHNLRAKRAERRRVEARRKDYTGLLLALTRFNELYGFPSPLVISYDLLRPAGTAFLPHGDPRNLRTYRWPS
jgi:hypothetical protein